MYCRTWRPGAAGTSLGLNQPRGKGCGEGFSARPSGHRGRRGGGRHARSPRDHRVAQQRGRSLGRARARGFRVAGAAHFRTRPSDRRARGAGGRHARSRRDHRAGWQRDRSLGRAGGCALRGLRESFSGILSASFSVHFH